HGGPARPAASAGRPVAPITPPPAQGAAGGALPRRGDAFDPSQNPNAPGAPRVLGSLPATTAVTQGRDAEEPRLDAPGGPPAGAPLDLSNLAGGARDPSG